MAKITLIWPSGEWAAFGIRAYRQLRGIDRDVYFWTCVYHHSARIFATELKKKNAEYNRKNLAIILGVARLSTISEAWGRLESAGWIRKSGDEYIPQPCGRNYQIRKLRQVQTPVSSIWPAGPLDFSVLLRLPVGDERQEVVAALLSRRCIISTPGLDDYDNPGEITFVTPNNIVTIDFPTETIYVSSNDKVIITLI